MPEITNDTLPASDQPATVIAPVFTATFTSIITNIKTNTVDDMVDVIKQVDWTLKGEETDQTFELPQTMILDNPNKDAFIKFSDITLAIVTAWVETSTTSLDAAKAQIQYVINKRISEAAFKTTAMPWKPVESIPPLNPASPLV